MLLLILANTKRYFFMINAFIKVNAELAYYATQFLRTRDAGAKGASTCTPLYSAE